jgi:hypothetical protein
MQREKLRAAPRVAGLCETYNMTVDLCSKGLRRVREGAELATFSENIGERRNHLLSLVASQMEETGTL